MELLQTKFFIIKFVIQTDIAKFGVRMKKSFEETLGIGIA